MALGYTVKELASRLDSQELSEWQAYDQIEPIGERRADIRAALISRTIASCFTHKDNNEPFTLADFLLHFGGEPENKPSAEELSNKIKLIRSMFGEIHRAQYKGQD